VALYCAGAEASKGAVARSGGGKWLVAGVGGFVGVGVGSVEGWSASSSARRRAARVGKEREKEGRRKEEGGEKEKGKGEKWRERKRERAVGGIRDGGRPCARCGVRPVSDEHAEREKGKEDRTAIGTGVGTADRRNFFGKKQDLG